MAEIQRRKTPTVRIGNVRVGWEVPVVVQSMTNTDTADIASTIAQVESLALAGSEIVRITVNNEDAAAAVPHIVDELEKRGLRVPIIGDFHYNGHILLKKYPATPRALAETPQSHVSIGRRNGRTSAPWSSAPLRTTSLSSIGVNWFRSIDATPRRA